MNNKITSQLKKLAAERQIKTDPSHDWQHILRVTNLAELIGKQEKADRDILIPAALFHDIIVYPKNSPKNKKASSASAAVAENILKKIKAYPKEKIASVAVCINECSFSKGLKPKLLESKILQDADRLEATGAISIMRTFSSGGQTNRPFYDPTDPFCQKGSVQFRSGLDLFYQRLLIVEQGMHTTTAKKMAKRRTKFLKDFLAELKLELKESNII
ncbi:MAG: HD domain-containing protein [Patescibacteria group bacterium]|nr:HD domain-containing protein [Patescibacteria group bacterium]